MEIIFKELTFMEVEKLQEMILTNLTSTNDSFIIDFVNVKKIDLVNIQLLLSLKKYCDKNNIVLDFVNINAKQVKKTLKLLNINSKLGIA